MTCVLDRNSEVLDLVQGSRCFTNTFYFSANSILITALLLNVFNIALVFTGLFFLLDYLQYLNIVYICIINTLLVLIRVMLVFECSRQNFSDSTFHIII